MHHCVHRAAFLAIALLLSTCEPLAAQAGMIGYANNVSSLWVPDAPVFNTAPLTVEGWIRIEFPPGTSAPDGVHIVHKGSGFTSYSLGLTSGTGGLVRANVWTVPAVSNWMFSNQALTTLTWYHAALVIDVGSASLYLNGILQETVALPGALAPTSGQPFLMGYVLGNLDEVRFWSVARSQAQIQEMMYRRLDHHPGLVSSWHFDGGFLDLTGGHHATLPSGSAFILPSTSPVGPSLGVPAQHPIWSPISFAMSHCAPSSPYLLEVSATGTSPGIPIPPPFPAGTFPLNPPFLFATYGSIVPSLFSGFVGTTDATGSAAGSLFIPAEPALIGLQISAAYAAFDAAVGDEFAGVSRARTTTITDFPPLAIEQVYPDVALPGQTVIVTGAGFRPTTTVTVAGASVGAASITPTEIAFSAPAAVCDSVLSITNAGQSLQVPFNPAPVIGSVSNMSGPAAGGHTMFLVGAHFVPGTTVTVGGISAQITFIFDTILAVVAPPGTPGPASVVVTSPTGCTASTVFTYY